MSDKSKAAHSQQTPPYSILAAGYDFVMSHVDYELWSEYVHQLILRHQPDAYTVLELGCGTGSLALVLQPLGSYRYLATDRSEQMITVARHKAEEAEADLRFDLADFTDFRVDTPVDVVILLYDGLNYLLDKKEVRKTFSCVYAALSDGGIFIVDQSTPANSINNEAYFENSDSLDEFSYVRRSRYDAATKLHQTTLEISVGERRFREEHLQRAYDLPEVKELVDEADFEVAAAYDGFSTAPASEESERVHWVLRKPEKRD